MTPSREEYQRRYTLIREAMRRQGYSCLVVCGSGDQEERGSLRYVFGHSVWDRWGYCVLPLEADPVAVLLTVSQRFWTERLGVVKDVRQHTSPIAEVIRVLAGLTGGQRQRIGMVGMDEVMRVADYRRLTAELPHLQFEDATDLMTSIQTVKSAEELPLVAEASRIADLGYRQFMAALAPGKTEWELNGVAQGVFFGHGAFDTLPLTLHGRGESFLHVPRGATYNAGEWLSYSVEIPSDHGYWVELARMFSLGEPAPEIRRLVDSLHRAHQAAIKQLRPGVRASEVVALVNEMVEADGYHTGIWIGHAIGLNIVEPPLLVATDDRPLQENMAIALHPQIQTADNSASAYVGDTVVVTRDGGRVLSEIPLEFFVK